MVVRVARGFWGVMRLVGAISGGSKAQSRPARWRTCFKAAGIAHARWGPGSDRVLVAVDFQPLGGSQHSFSHGEVDPKPEVRSPKPEALNPNPLWAASQNGMRLYLSIWPLQEGASARALSLGSSIQQSQDVNAQSTALGSLDTLPLSTFEPCSSRLRGLITDPREPLSLILLDLLPPPETRNPNAKTLTPHPNS